MGCAVLSHGLVFSHEQVAPGPGAGGPAGLPGADPGLPLLAGGTAGHQPRGLALAPGRTDGPAQPRAGTGDRRSRRRDREGRRGRVLPDRRRVPPLGGAGPMIGAILLGLLILVL